MDFSPQEFEEETVRVRHMQFLFKNDDRYAMMDAKTYEQLDLTAQQIGDLCNFMKEGLEGIKVMIASGFVVAVQLPPTVELCVREVTMQIDDKTGRTESMATLETGLKLVVPAHVKAEDIVVVDTITGKLVKKPHQGS